MPKQVRAVVVGCGDIGSRVAVLLQQQGWQVYGLRRNTAHLPARILPISADLYQAECPRAWPQEPIDYVVYAMAAQTMSEDGYQQAYVQVSVIYIAGWHSISSNRSVLFLFPVPVFMGKVMTAGLMSSRLPNRHAGLGRSCWRLNAALWTAGIQPRRCA